MIDIHFCASNLLVSRNLSPQPPTIAARSYTTRSPQQSRYIRYIVGRMVITLSDVEDRSEAR